LAAWTVVEQLQIIAFKRLSVQPTAYRGSLSAVVASAVFSNAGATFEDDNVTHFPRSTLFSVHLVNQSQSHFVGN